MIWLLLGFVLLALAVWKGPKLAAADPRTIATNLRMAGAGLAGLGAIFLLLRGQIGVAMGLGALASGLFMAAQRRGPRFAKAAQTEPSSEQVSELVTDFLEMSLDHTAGTLCGHVRKGRYKGRDLVELSMAELIELYEECRHADPQSGMLLETYLDRIHGPDWRNAARNAKHPDSNSAMTREEARRILGVGPDASVGEIQAAHRRLMQKLHPDHGGSDYLAAKLNEAKDTLLP